MTAVLFDLDGVLVDVTRSYHLTIRKVVSHFTGRPVTTGDITEIKNLGNANNDWEAARLLIIRRGKHIPATEITKKFQQIHLGKNRKGLILQDKWLADPDILCWIKTRFSTGIVTGRPGPEADFALKRFDARHHFDVVVTMDDIPGKQGKPDPSGIKLALGKLGTNRGYYLGDTVDDMKAAAAARIMPVGVIPPGADPFYHRELLLKSGAFRVINSINDIGGVINETYNQHPS